MSYSVAYVRYASLKGRMKLESVGIRFKGGATRPKIAKELGLRPRDSYEAYIAEIQRRMDELLAQERAGGVQ